MYRKLVSDVCLLNDMTVYRMQKMYIYTLCTVRRGTCDTKLS